MTQSRVWGGGSDQQSVETIVVMGNQFSCPRLGDDTGE